jgi:Zn-dependent peptidase ImmA (M78 family)
VLNSVYTVAIFDEVEVEGKGVRGSTDIEDKLIELETNKDRRALWNTLFHEIAHAWMEESGLNGHFSEEVEEMVALSVEKHLIPTILHILGKEYLIRKG